MDEQSEPRGDNDLFSWETEPAVVLGMAFLAIVAVTAAGVRAQWQARRQTLLAHDFKQELRYIEDRLRYAYSAPLHDVRPEKEDVRNHLRWIEDKMKHAGSGGIARRAPPARRGPSAAVAGNQPGLGQSVLHPRPATRRAVARSATPILEEAFRIDPGMKHEYGPVLESAHRLAEGP